MSAAPMTPEQQKLRVVLLALLPKDGTPMAIRALAKVACVPVQSVTEVLFNDYMTGALAFDVRADTFSAIRQGDML